MALRLASSRLALRALRTSTTSGPRLASRTYASAVAVPVTSSITHENHAQYRREVALPNADPPADSNTATFLDQSVPYMVPTYVRPPPMMVQGEGCILYDNENRQYLDFTAGIAVCSLGHADPEIARVIAHQAQTLLHASNLYHNPWTPTLSKLMIEETEEQSPGTTLSQVFVSNSGSEANEAAIKFARKVAYAKDPESTQRERLSRSMTRFTVGHMARFQLPPTRSTNHLSVQCYLGFDMANTTMSQQSTSW